MSDQSKRISDLVVMQRMAERDMDIRMTTTFLHLKKVKRGTEVTLGIAGDVVASIADGTLIGGLYLVDKKEFFAVKEELEQG